MKASLLFLPVVILLIAKLSHAQEYWLEGECAVVGSTWEVLPDGDASQGQYIQASAGTNSLTVPPAATADHTRFTFTVDEAGEYNAWGRVSTLDPGHDSFWVRLDNGTWIQWNSIQPGTAWHWDEVHDSNNSNQVVSYLLGVGSHTLDIAYRERGTKLDKLYLVKTGNTPSGLGALPINCDDPGNPGTGEIVQNGLIMDLDIANYTGSSTWQDASTANNDGVIQSGFTLLNGHLHGTSGRIRVNGVQIPANSNNFTVSYWIRADSIVASSTNSNQQFRAANSASGDFFSFNDSENRYVGGTSNNFTIVWRDLYEQGTWQMVTFILRNGLGVLRKNGTTLSFKHMPANAVSWDGFLMNNIDGDLDKVFIYDRAISNQEDLDNYNATSPRFLGGEEVPITPGTLSANAISSTQVNLSWADNSTNETGFEIERSTGDNSSYSSIATTAAGVTTYQDNGNLSAATTYYYRVRAVNATGASGYSNEANATTLPGSPGNPAGDVFYVSVDGTPAGDGSVDNPWDLQTALGTGTKENPVGNPAVGPGDLIYVRGGIYRGLFRSYLMGDEGNPVVVKPYPGDYVKIDGGKRSEMDGVDPEGLLVSGRHTWFYDFEVTSSEALNYRGGNEGQSDDVTSGVTIYGPYCKVINFIVHNNTMGLSTRVTSPLSAGYQPHTWASGAEFYGSISFGNGWRKFGSSRDHGHGAYTQNSIFNDNQVMESNLFFNNFDLLYQHRSSNSDRKASNVIYKNSFLFEGEVTYEGGGDPSVPGAERPKQIFFNDNWLYETVVEFAQIGLHRDVHANDNLVYRSTLMPMNLTEFESVGNTFYHINSNGDFGSGVWFNQEYLQYRNTGAAITLMSGDMVIDNNLYLGEPVFGYGTNDYFGGEGTSFLNWNEWTTVNDQNSILSLDFPNAPKVKVVKNKYVDKRGMIGIFRFNNEQSVSVDLSSLGFQTGDEVMIINAFDPVLQGANARGYKVIETIVYDGNNYNFSLQGLTVAGKNGYNTPGVATSSYDEANDDAFVFLAIGKESPPASPAARPAVAMIEEALGTSTPGVQILMHQNYPNPVNRGVTSIDIELPAKTAGSIVVYDNLAARAIYTEEFVTDDTGKYSIQLDTHEYKNGIYLIQLHTQGQRVTKKMIVNN